MPCRVILCTVFYALQHRKKCIARQAEKRKEAHAVNCNLLTVNLSAAIDNCFETDSTQGQFTFSLQ
jgi:hypothetical protein